MASNLLEKFGTSNQTITLTAASLTNGASREGTVIDNSSNLFQDAGVFVKLKSGGASTASNGYCTVYTYATSDGGTSYTDTCTGSDAAVTLTIPPQVKQIGVINMVADATTYKAGPFSVASAWGYLPEKWGIVIQNKTGGTLDATGGSHSIFYQGIYQQSS